MTSISPFPPQVPTELADLHRAIMLLGSRVQVKLTPKRQKELEALLSCYANANTAAAWKSALKELRRDEIFDP